MRAERWLYTIVYGGPVWFRDLLRRNQAEEELDEELQFHLERQIQEDVAHGIDPVEARTRALQTLRGVDRVKQECRDVRRANVVEDLIKDAAHGGRTLRKAPVFTVTAILTIALGIGLSTAIFSVTNAVLLRPLPYPDANRLVMALRDMPKRDVRDYPMSTPDFMDIRNQSGAVFEDLAAIAISTRSTVLPRAEGSLEQVHIQTATANLLPLLGAKTALGQVVSQSPDAAILSYEYWQRRYGGDESILGRKIPEIGAVVTGVLAPGFELLLPPRLELERAPDIWMPWPLRNSDGGRNAGNWRMLGRLKQGVSRSQAQSVMDQIAAQFEKTDAVKATSGVVIRLEPMRHYLVAEVQPTILALLGAVTFLLLIACANVANLLLVRAALRDREFAMRASLGGTLFRLTRQLITEGLVLASLGASAGLGLAWIALRELHRIAPATPGLANLPRLAAAGIDPEVVGFAILATFAAAVIFGIVPAYRAASPDVIRVLRSNPTGPGAAASSNIVRNAIIAIEIAMSLVLLVGSGLMFRSFVALRHVGLGYDPRGVLIFRTTGASGDLAQRGAFVTEMQRHLRALPDVEAVTSSSALPLGGGFTVIRWGKENQQPDSIAGAADYQSVSPGYFEALRTPLLDGRTFRAEDNVPGRRVVIIDEVLAEREFPNQSAAGKRLMVSIPGEGPQQYEVIGVVAHQRDTSLAEPGRAQIYATEGFAGHPLSGYWAVRTPERVKCAKAIRAELAKLDKNVAVTEMEAMSSFVERAEAGTRFSLLLIGIFAAIAALLAGIGIYGVLATMVRQRTSEIGIRIAMGATPWSIFRLVVGHGMLLTTAGVVAGLMASLVLTRAMSGILIEVKPTDPVTFGAMAAVFFAIAAMASWLPARRASALDPALAVKA